MVMEFFVSGGEVLVQTEDGVTPLREGDAFVPFIVEHVRELYPKAYEALCSVYGRSRLNVTYFDFLVARRFCKCNFGSLDHTKADVDGGAFHLERVSCPLLGECPHEGVICMPQMETRLSAAEGRVMRLVCEGMGNAEIAEELFLSPNTVKRHISTAYIKTCTRNRAEFVKFAKDNSIFI